MDLTWVLNWTKSFFQKENIPPTPQPWPVEAAQGQKPVWEMSLILEAITSEADRFVGMRETHGKNRSPVIDAIVKEQGGSPGFPYCLYWCQHIIARVCEILEITKTIPKGGSTQTMWNLLPAKYKSETAIPGGLVFWRSRTRPAIGHVGIAIAPSNIGFKSIEANTGSDGLSRDGDGIYQKTRSYKGSTNLRYLGCFDLVRFIYDSQLNKK